MTRTHGWAPRGKRLLAKVPHRQWETTTFLAALRHDRIDAPCLFDGPINGERFLAYVKQKLVPTLKPGDVVILDNLGSHTSQAVRQAIRKVGAKRILLSKYSPDLNPIEQVFAKLKALLRKAAPRSPDDICTAVGQLLDSFKPEECANYFRNSGYVYLKAECSRAPPDPTALREGVLLDHHGGPSILASFQGSCSDRCQQEQSKWAAREGPKSEAAVEIGDALVLGIDDDSEDSQRAPGPENSLRRIGEQELTDTPTAGPHITRQPADDGRRDRVIAGQLLRDLLRQVGKRQGIGTQRIEADYA